MRISSEAELRSAPASAKAKHPEPPTAEPRRVIQFPSAA